MNITFVDGDLTEIESLPMYNESRISIVGQAVNCRGKQGAGLAKQMKAKYPIQFMEYEELCNSEPRSTQYKLLGHAQITQINSKRFIFNAFTQIDYGRQGLFTVYGGVNKAFRNLKFEIELIQQNFHGLDQNNESLIDVYLPFEMCCGLAGGEWSKVLPIIEDNLRVLSINLIFVNKKA